MPSNCASAGASQGSDRASADFFAIMRSRASGNGVGHGRFGVQDAVLELVFSQRGRILPEVLVEEPHGPVARRGGCAASHAAGPQLGAGMDGIQRIAVTAVGAGGDGGCCG
jgi:hypothetical protein